MITIFHGDDLALSRQTYLDQLTKVPLSSVFHTDSKNINLNEINNFLEGGSLFADSKIIAIDNFFSIPKANQVKLIKLLEKSSVDILLWQDKMLTAAQLKILPKAITNRFKSDNHIFPCLSSLKPHNLAKFMGLYHQVCAQELFDLFLYLLKQNFRKQIQTHSIYPQIILVKTYLQLIELEFQFKTGQLSLPREIALERVLIPLLK
ncbi:MAG: hypothetical protein WAV41_04100 [Microgenomates group bacterium]